MASRGRGRGRGAVKPDPDAAAPAPEAPAPAPSSSQATGASPAPKKFEPKVAPRRMKKVEVKSEPGEMDAAQIQKLIQDAQNAAQRRGFRTGESKATVTRVAFGSGGTATYTAKPSAGFAKSRGGSGGGGGGGGGWRGPDRKPTGEAGALIPDETGFKAKPSVFDTMDDAGAYKPISLPLRRPLGVGTEFSDEEDEDDDAPTDLQEDQIPASKELGLETESPDERLLFLQFPSLLPFTSGPEMGLEKYPQGLMGKLRIYESGAIKLHLGDSVMNVYPGTRGVFSQEVVAINSNTKKCAFLGDVGQRLVVTPDIDGLLDGSS